jgi:hypothetical protein
VREYFDRELLERYRPELRYDRQYDYRVTAVETIVDNPGNLLRRGDGEVIARAGGHPSLTLDVLTAYPAGVSPDRDDCLAEAPDYLGDARRMEPELRYTSRVYGRCVDDGGRTWLQYWFWLYYNPKNLFGFGKHEGDWEMMQLGLGAHGRPEVATYAQHDSGEARRVSGDQLEFVADGADWHPVVYVAPLSHASYFEAQSHPYLIGIDHPYGDGPKASPPIAEFGAWNAWPGHWGSSERVIAGRIGNGPASPGNQGRKWTSPARWHGSMRRRWARVLLGTWVHALGTLSFPPSPEIDARIEHIGPDAHAVIKYRLAGRGFRQARHLYITVHDGDNVIASRALKGARTPGRSTVRLPYSPEHCVVYASAFNRLRQRSDLAQA